MTLKTVAADVATVLLVSCAVIMTVVVVRREVLHRGSAVNVQRLDRPRLVHDWPAVSGVGHRIGPVGASVTVVEFGDFECPACRVFANTALKGVRARYPSDVALVFRHLPLGYHRFAYPAARAAECAASQGRFEAFFDAVYRGQDSLGLKPFSQFAAESGMPDLTVFAKCNSSNAPVPAIEMDLIAAKALQPRGTPTIIIDGLQLGGVPDSAGFDRMVRDELAKVRNR